MNAMSARLGRMARQHRGGLRAPAARQRAVVGAQQPHAGRQPRREVRVVGLLARRVDDEHQHAVLVRHRPSA